MIKYGCFYCPLSIWGEIKFKCSFKIKEDAPKKEILKAVVFVKAFIAVNLK